MRNNSFDHRASEANSSSSQSGNPHSMQFPDFNSMLEPEAQYSLFSQEE